MIAKHPGRPRRAADYLGLGTPSLSSLMAGVLILAATGELRAQVASGQQGIWTTGTAFSLPAITVSGEKVKRSNMDTSSSVEVFDSSRLKEIPNAKDVHDVLELTPNIVDTGTGNYLPTVRGVDGSGPAVGAVAFLAGSRPRFNLAIDGRSLTYNEQAFGTRSLWDVEKVEVYRGPQSLLQGRNSIAGATIIETKNPTPFWEGAVKAGIGEQKSRQMSAMLSGPIIDDQVEFRVALDRQQRESFVKLQSYDPVGDPRDYEATTARAKLLLRPKGLPDLSSMFTVAHYDSRAPQQEQQPAPPGSPRFDPLRPVFETRSTSGTWDLSWQQSEQISFENKLIYTAFSNDRLTKPNSNSANIDAKEFSIEPLAHLNSADKRLRTMVGLRYFHNSQDERVDNLQPAPVSTYTFDDKTRTASSFAEVTYAVIPEVDVTVAGRYENERRDRSGGNATGTRIVNFKETYGAFLPKLDVAWKPNTSQTYGAKVARGFNAGGAGITFTSGNNYTYDPEYVWNYEIYGRQRLADDRVELTGNLFYNDYEDYQLPFTVGAGNIEIRNAKKATTYGLEAGARWRPVEDLEMFSSAGLLKTKINEAFTGYNIDGHELPRAPKVTAALGATWAFAKDFDLSGNMTYSSSYYSAIDNDARGKIKSHWLANAELGYNFSFGRATLYAENLFDANDRVFIDSNDETAPFLQRPRIIGASMEMRF